MAQPVKKSGTYQKPRSKTVKKKKKMTVSEIIKWCKTVLYNKTKL